MNSTKINITKINKDSKKVRLLITIIIGVIGSLVFKNIHLPLPWLLGSMTALLIGSKVFKINLFWPSNVRNLGLLIIGYSCGVSIGRDTIFQIIQQLPWMLVTTVTLIAFSALTAMVVSKLSGIDYPSVLIGNVPGALTQMTAIGEEMEGANLTVITFLQVVRVMLVVFCVPLLIFSPLYSSVKSSSATTAASLPLDVFIPKFLLFLVISLVFAIMAKKLRFPTAYLLGPILGIAVLNVLGFHGPKPVPVVLEIAQFIIGCHLGLQLKPEKLQNKAKIITLGIINGVIMIIFSLGQSYLLIKMHGLEAATSFLSTAPGGTDQMGVIASVISANVSIVTGYQVFRMILVNFAVPPLLKRFCNYYMKSCPTDKFSSGKDIQC